MNTKQDAAARFSGVQDWEFADGITFDDLCEYVTGSEVDLSDESVRNEVLAEFLSFVGENPADYGIAVSA